MHPHPTPTLAALVVALGLGACGAAGPQVLVRGGTVLTITQGVIEGGAVLIEGGRIAAVGTAAEVRARADAKIIDAQGRWVMPGIVDNHSHMGVYAWPGVQAHSDGNEATSPVTSEVRVMDGLNFADPAFDWAVAGGVTTAHILHGSANVIGGQDAILKLRRDRSPRGMAFPDAPPGIKFASGENPKRVYGERNASPSTRMGNFMVVREALTKAREYAAKHARWETKDEEAKADGKPPERNLRLEALAEVLAGERRVYIHCYRADELLNYLALAKEFGFKIASFEHVLEGYKVADALAAHGVGASTFADWWGYKVEAFDAIPYNAAMMTRRGVRVAIKSDSAVYVQFLNQEAAKTMKYGGLTRDEALALITINPATIMGIEARVGSLEVGKDGDLSIWDRDPTSVYAKTVMTLIDGEVIFDRDRDGHPWAPAPAGGPR